MSQERSVRDVSGPYISDMAERGGIVSVVAEREVRVGEGWNVSCFQYGLPI